MNINMSKIVTLTISLRTCWNIWFLIGKCINWVQFLKTFFAWETEYCPVSVARIWLFGWHLEDLSWPRVVGSEHFQFSLTLSEGQFMASWVLRRKQGNIYNVFKISYPIKLNYICSSVSTFNCVTHVSHSSTIMHWEVTLAQYCWRYNELNMDIQISGRISPSQKQCQLSFLEPRNHWKRSHLLGIRRRWECIEPLKVSTVSKRVCHSSINSSWDIIDLIETCVIVITDWFKVEAWVGWSFRLVVQAITLVDRQRVILIKSLICESIKYPSWNIVGLIISLEESKRSKFNSLSNWEPTHKLVNHNLLETSLIHLNSHCIGDGVIKQTHAKFKYPIRVYLHILTRTVRIEGKRYLHLYIRVVS